VSTPLAVAYSVTLLGERLPLACIPPERCPAALSRLLAQSFEAEPRRRSAHSALTRTRGERVAGRLAKRWPAAARLAVPGAVRCSLVDTGH
jgi:hypothetical protein